MDIEAVIEALGGRYDADEAAIIERMLREYGGTIPDAQLIEEIGLALAIHRRAGADLARPDCSSRSLFAPRWCKK